MLGLELSVFFFFLGALLLILLLGKIFLWPLKLIGKLLISSLVGGVLILVVNLIAGMFGLLLIPLNIITAVVVGVLGIPGVIFLLILFLF